MTPSRGLQNGNSNILGRIQGGVPYDGQWHNIIWAWNTNTGGSSPWVINSTLDRAPVGETVVNLGSSTSGFSVDYAVTDQWIVCSEAGRPRAFQRLPIDSTSNWSYSSATWRAANNSTSSRVNWIDGLGQSVVEASYSIETGNGGGSRGDP